MPKANPPSSPSAGFTTIRRIHRGAEVRSQLEAAIRRGDYGPGERLPSERELVAMLGVSRVSIREALHALEALGYVSVQHGRGVFVTDRRSSIGKPMARWLELHRDERIELLEVRAALDGSAVQMAVKRYLPAAIERIEAAHDAFRAAVENDASPQELAELDGRFHLAIADAAGNRLLYDLLVDFTDYLSVHRQFSLALEGRPQLSLAEHSRIVEAILEQDADAAAEAMAVHMASLRTLFEQQRPAKR